MNAVVPMTDTGPMRRPNRLLWVALIVSLAVNLLVLGAMAGAIWKFHHRPLEARFNPNLAGFTSTLPEERRQQLWQATAAERNALKALRMDVREAREKARAVLIEEPFDSQRFADAESRVLDAEMKVRAAAQKLFVAIASRLTPEERATYARGVPSDMERRGRPTPAENANGRPPAPR